MPPSIPPMAADINSPSELELSPYSLVIIYVIKINTKKYKDLTEDGYCFGTTWSKNKKWVAFVSGKGTSENPHHIWKMNIKKQI